MKCKLCFQYGHFDSNCPDSWRRSHFTTEPGPSKIRTDRKFKRARDRWCSICRSQGHFKYECHRNRTHSANNPRRGDYNDYTNSGREISSESESSFTSHNYFRNPSHSNSKPSINTQTRDSYVPHSSTSNPSFSQHYPMSRSISPSDSLQQDKNAHYQDPKMEFTPPHVSDEHIGNGSVSVTSTKFPIPTPQRLTMCVKIGRLQVHRLRLIEGRRFLNELQKRYSISINMFDRSKNFECIIKGSNREDLKIVREEMLTFSSCYRPFVLRRAFSGNPFCLEELEANLASLDNPDVNWYSVADSFYYKIEKTQSRISKPNKLRNRKKYSHRITEQMKTINAILIGKLLVEDGVKHMENLRQYSRGQQLDIDQRESLRKSYEYVFNSAGFLSIPYHDLINKLPVGESLENATRELMETGVENCEKNNLMELLENLKMAYKNVVGNKYHQTQINQFIKVLDMIDLSVYYIVNSTV